MGYTTEFTGSLTLTPPATLEQVKYVNLLGKTRRMKRNVNTLTKLYEGQFGLLGSSEYGIEGEFFAREDGEHGQSRDESIIEYNYPSSEQPGLWLNWELSEDGSELQWDGGEKFYFYVEWLEWLNEKLFEPWGITLHGAIQWQGEEMDDRGEINVAEGVMYSGNIEEKGASLQYQINSAINVCEGRLENGADVQQAIEWLQEEVNKIFAGEVLYKEGN